MELRDHARMVSKMKSCQASYDSMNPPSYYDNDDDTSCPECGALVVDCEGGWICDKGCGWSNTIEEKEAA